MLEDAMTSQIRSSASGFRPVAAKLLLSSLLALTLSGCKTFGEPGHYIANYNIVDPSQKNPIMVT